MLGSVIGVLARVGTWAAAVKGADVVVSGAKDFVRNRSPKMYPIVAGFGDTAMNVLDPLDLTGTRKAKEDQRQAELAAAQGSAKKQKELAKKEAAKAKAAQNAQKKAEARIRAAEKKAKELEAKYKKAVADGKHREAELLRKQAQSSRRWAQTAQRMNDTSKTSTSPDQSLAIAQAAIELAKQANNPPMNAAYAIANEASAAGKSIMATMVDAINREEEPDYDGLVARLNANDPTAYGDLVDLAMLDEDISGPDSPYAASESNHDDCEGEHCPGNSRLGHPVSGSCCASCSYGGSCGGKTIFADPKMVNGDVAGEDFLDDGTSGPVDFGDFFASVDGAGDEEDYFASVVSGLDDEDIDFSQTDKDDYAVVSGGECQDGLCNVAWDDAPRE